MQKYISLLFSILLMSFLQIQNAVAQFAEIIIRTDECFVTKQQNVTICEGDSAVVGTSIYFNTGQYRDTLPGGLDCDTIIFTALNVRPKFAFTQSPVICQGDSIKVGNKVYRQTGTYKDTLSSVFSCDSIITTNLTVRPTFTFTQSPVICQGDSIKVGNKVYRQTGTYKDTLSSVFNCDSIITTNLTVRPTFTFTQSPVICQGDSIKVGNKVYRQTGTYKDTLSSVFSCDSIITTNLTVRPTFAFTQSPVICQGDSIKVGNKVYRQTGTYKDTLSSVFSCDSIITTNLTVRPTFTFTQSPVICQGDSIKVGNKVYRQTGTYKDTLSSVFSCDSIITTNLTVRPTFTFTQSPVICQGDSIKVGNKVYRQTGTYKDTLSSVFSCDSIITTNLTVRPVSRVQQSFNICQGDSVKVGNKVYKLSGVYTDTLKNSFNCDSILTTVINILGSQPVQIVRSICQGDTLRVGDNIYVSNGNYTDTLISLNGCDSIVQLSLTVIPAKFRILTFIICSGQSVQVGNNTYNKTGTYTDTLTSNAGCDSIVTTNLTVNPVFSRQQSLTICNGDSVIVGNRIYKISGLYTDTLKTIRNCDSIIITTLIVNPTFNRSQNISICSGQSYTVGTNTYTTSGTYRDTLSTVRNCDSIIVTTLSVLSQISKNQNVSICEGQSYSIGGNVYTQTGVYRDTFPSSGGCDSIVITNLTVSNVVSANAQASICQGDLYQFGDTILQTAGIYTQILPGTAGCDSVVTLTLTVNPKKETTINRTACQGDSIIIRGNVYTQSGTIKFVEETYLGCDSTINYILLFNKRDNISRNLTICVPGTFEGINITKDTIIVRRLQNIFSCDSIVTNNINAAFPDAVEANNAICFGTRYEGYVIKKDTTIEKRLLNIEGCDSIVTESIAVLPLPVLTVTRDTTINPGNQVTLFASGAVTYVWSTGSQGAAINVNPAQSTIYTVTGTGENGCSDTARIRVDVNECIVDLPTLFTPNGDGIHDLLQVKNAGCLADFKMTILNRWGNIIFETTAIDEPWDGTNNGTPVSEGVFYYIISARSIVSNTPILEKGYVHLKR